MKDIKNYIMLLILPKICFFFIVIVVSLYPDTAWTVVLKQFKDENDTFKIEHIYDLEIDNLGNVWAGFNNGFGIYDGYALKRFKSYYYTVISKDLENSIWTFNEQNGFIAFKDTNLTEVSIETGDEMPEKNFTDFFQASDGTYWITVTNGGVFSSTDLLNWTNHYPTPLPKRNYKQVLEDKLKRIWVCSAFTSEVACFDGNNWTIYNQDNSPVYKIYCMAADSSGNMWFSSVDEIEKHQQGLFKFDGENWTQYNSENSNLPYNDSYGMVVDRAGYLWLITGECDFLRFTGDTFEIRDNSWFPRYGAAADNMLVDYRM
ncbi:MAG: hypothetical protein GXY77_17915 [Fibrobacter sp.]|nr:hypothetical protein [Fibrobacter sp.]